MKKLHKWSFYYKYLNELFLILPKKITQSPMKFIKLILVFVTAFNLNFQNTYAQEKNKTKSINEGDIEEQFGYLITKSNNYQDYKVVKKVLLNQLRNNTIDSINDLNNNLKLKDDKIIKQDSEISELNSKLIVVSKNYEAVSIEKDQLNFLGIATSKSIYNTLIWSLIGILILIILILIYKFIECNRVTKHAKNQLLDLEKEYEDHRRIALEREQKVRRQLQDEINKQKGI